MKFLRKIRLRHFFKAVRLPLLTALLIIVALNAWCETAGVPVVFAKFLSRGLAKQGISCHVGKLKAGFFRGLQAYDLVVWDGQVSGRQMFAARRVRLKLRKGSLLLGRIRLSGAQVFDGALYFPAPSGRDDVRRMPFSLDSISLDADITPEKVTLGRFSGTLNGLWVHASGTIVGLQDIAAKSQGGRDGSSADMPTRLSWERVDAGMPDALREVLTYVRDFLDDQLFITADALIRTSFHVDLADFNKCEADALFQLTGISINDIAIPTFKGHLRLNQAKLFLLSGNLDMGGTTFVTADGMFDLSSRNISGTLSGAVAPRVVYRFFDHPMPEFLAQLSFPSPPRISLSVAESPIMALKQWRLSGNCQVNNLIWEGTYLRSMAFDFEREAGITRIRNLSVLADAAGSESLTLNCQMRDHDLSLSGQAVARFAPARLLRLIPEDYSAARQLLREVQMHAEMPTLSVALDRACLNPFELRGEAKLEAENLSFRDIPVDRLVLPVLFDGEFLQTAPEGMTLVLDDQQRVSVHSSFNVKERIASFKGEASVFPNRIYQGLGLPYSELLAELQMTGPPLLVSCEMDSMRLGGQDWRISGAIEAEEAIYGACTVDRATADFSISPDRIRVSDIRAKSFQLRDFAIQEVVHNWGQRTTTLKLEGNVDPRLFSAFIPPSDRHIYEDLWQPFDWGETDPRLLIRSFHLRLYRLGGFALNLAGEINDDSLTLYGIPLGDSSAHVTLQLPQKVIISQIKISRDNRWLAGSVGFELGGEPILTLNCEGVFDPVLIGGKVVPQLGHALQGVTAGIDTRLSLDGQVYLRGKSRPEIHCRMEGRELAAKGLVLRDYVADWQLSNHELKWRISNGNLFGGTLVADGYSNGFTDSAEVEAHFKQVKLTDLLTSYTEKPVTDKLGHVSGSFSVRKATSVQDGSAALVGEGKVKVRDGEFWRTPLLESLVQVVGLSGVGQITACDAELEFRGDHLAVPRFATDGTLLALRGDGVYHWAGPKKGLDFVVKGEVLKATSLIPLLTRPLAWFFEAELKGTLKDPRWRMRSPLRIISPGKEEGAEEGEFELLKPRK